LEYVYNPRPLPRLRPPMALDNLPRLSALVATRKVV
jgi:hypothetical protein